MVSPTNKKRGPFSNRRSARPCANRRPAESRHHNGSGHHCRRSASAFVRLSALRPTCHRGKNGRIRRRGPLRSRPPGRRGPGHPVNPATFRHSSHGGTCCSPPSGCQARSRQRRWPEGPGFTARWWGADNRTCDQITRTQPLHLRFSAIGQVLRRLCADSHSR